MNNFQFKYLYVCANLVLSIKKWRFCFGVVLLMNNLFFFYIKKGIFLAIFASFVFKKYY